MSYNQLAESQRYQIDVLMRIGKSQREAARILRVSSSTISRELRRNSRDGCYCPVSAQRASDRRKKKRK
ncbi:MAG: helix-turn-helix domain-containing protein [bacterium]|nr:helix-turn-helix domain-containing protein [bacterium]